MELTDAERAMVLLALDELEEKVNEDPEILTTEQAAAFESAHRKFIFDSNYN